MKTQSAGRNKLAMSIDSPARFVARKHQMSAEIDCQGGSRFDERQLKTGGLFQYITEWEIVK